jgi:PKD repeat protein
MKALCSFVLAILFGSGMSGQVIVDSEVSAEDAVTTYFLSNGVFVSDVIFNTGDEQVGSFDCVDCNLGLVSGLILATGDVAVIEGPNNSGSQTLLGGNIGVSDVDLELLIPGFTLNDAAVLEFDFIATGDSLAFEYVFGSDEYPEFVNSSFNDVFGFFISGPGIEGTFSNEAVNIAMVPGPDLPLSINTVNAGLNAAYYVDNSEQSEDITQIQQDGFTTPLLAAIGDLVIGEIYHIKLAIADAADAAFDSVVCLSDDSFVQFCSEEPQISGMDCLVSTVQYDFEYTVDCGVIDLVNTSEMNIDATNCYWDMDDGTLIEGCVSVAQHEYEEPGNYQVKLVYEFNGFQASEIKNVTISEWAPPVPIIDQTGNELFLTNWDGESTIQWYLNGEIIEGANAETLIISEGGTYSVSMANGCLSVSEEFDTSIQEADGSGFQIYPNPSSGMLNCELPVGFTQLMVFDMGGQLVYDYQILNSVFTIKLEPRGAYLFEFISDSGASYKRRVVVR